MGILIQNFLHGGIHRIDHGLSTALAAYLGLHTTGNVQHEDHIDGSYDHMLVLNQIFLTQRGQGDTKGIGVVMVESTVVIVTEDDGFIGQNPAVVILLTAD